MGQQATIQAAVSNAFNGLGDLKQLITHRAISGTTYDPGTGEVTPTTVEQPNVPAVFTEYATREIDGTTIVSGDIALLIPTTSLNVTPKVDDIFVDGTDEWRVVNLMIDPANALWTIQVRR